MLKFIITKDVNYKGKLYRGRRIIGEEKMLALIYPLIGKAIFTSGWRSEIEQRAMVNAGVSQTMDSNHRRGVAFDIWNYDEMKSEMNKLGFIDSISWDRYHFPFGGEYSARKYPIINKLPAKLEEYNQLNNNMETEHQKNYRLVAEEIAKKIKYKYGKNFNDKERKEIISDIKKLPLEVERIVEKIVQVDKIKTVEVIKEKLVFKEIGEMTLGDIMGQVVRIIKNKWNLNK